MTHALLCSLLTFSILLHLATAQCPTIPTPEGEININALNSKQYTNFATSDYKGCDITQPVSAFQKPLSGSMCHYMGINNAKTSLMLKEPSNPKGGVVLKYMDGETAWSYSRTTQVDVICDETDSQIFTCASSGCEEKNPATGIINYHFTLKAKAACPGQGGGGDGGRPPLWPVGILGLLAIIFAVLIQLYWPIGLIVNKFVRKKEGIEIIPNVAFWKDLPFLIKDGVLLVFKDIMYDKIISKIVAKIRNGRGGGNYEAAA